MLLASALSFPACVKAVPVRARLRAEPDERDAIGRRGKRHSEIEQTELGTRVEFPDRLRRRDLVEAACVVVVLTASMLRG